MNKKNIIINLAMFIGIIIIVWKTGVFSTLQSNFEDQQNTESKQEFVETVATITKIIDNSNRNSLKRMRGSKSALITFKTKKNETITSVVSVSRLSFSSVEDKITVYYNVHNPKEARTTLGKLAVSSTKYIFYFTIPFILVASLFGFLKYRKSFKKA
jgi:hypothetical protein